MTRFNLKLILVIVLSYCMYYGVFGYDHSYEAGYDINGNLLAVSSVPGDGRFPMLDRLYKGTSKYLRISSSTVDWSDILLMIFVYDSPETNKLIEAHLKTWLRHVGKGADIVFITDAVDTRKFEEILPAKDDIEATLHVYRSPAKDDGKHLKFKVIDGLRYAGQIEFLHPKKYFFKVDSDTYVIPQNMLTYLNEIHKQTYPRPVQIGWASCSPVTFCYSAGPIYGFNNAGLNLANLYFKHHPAVVAEKHPHPTTGSNFMTHEDYMVSYAFKEATKVPILHNRLMLQRKFEDIGPGLPLTKRVAISYHPIKDPGLFYQYEGYFYREDGSMRTYDEVYDIYNKVKK